MSSLKNWTKVYSFTFTQQMKKKSYKTTTILVAIIIFAAAFLSIYFVEKEDDEVSVTDIEKLYIYDNTQYTNTPDYKSYYKDDDMSKINIQTLKTTDIVNKANKKDKKEILDKKIIEEKFKNLLEDDDKSAAIIISSNDKNILFTCYLGKKSSIDSDIAKKATDKISTTYSENFFNDGSLSDEDKQELFTPSVTSVKQIGKDDSSFSSLVEMLSPMAVAFVIYFMIFFTSDTVATEVSTEKTSKLIETILTCVKPYALIFGKILSVCTTTLIQLILWVVSGIGGTIGATYLLQQDNPSYTNPISVFIKLLKTNFSNEAMSPTSILISILLIILGFVVYSVIAGVVGSIASKPEDLANFKMFYIFPLLISFFISFAVVYDKGGEALKYFSYYFPLTSPLIVPGKVLIGTMKITEGLISLGIIILGILLLTKVAAKLYKGLLMYTGESFSLRKIRNVLKSENK